MRIILSGLLTSLVLLLSCGTTARIIRQTDKLLVIEGVGRTKYEAKDKARAKAKEIFGSFQEQGEPDCSKKKEAHYSDDNGYGHMSTYFSCVIEFTRMILSKF